MIKKELIVENERKLHNLLQDYGFSFADVNKMLRNKDVRVDGKVVKENVTLETKSVVTFYYTPDMLEKKCEKVFDCADAVVIYKSAGIETEGEKGLEDVLGGIAVHRLDRNTEGLMVFAKNEQSAENLKKAFKDRKVHKYYLAEVVGHFEVNQVFEAYLVKNSENSSVKIFEKPTKDAVKIATEIKTLKAGKESSVVQVNLLTGKTHQIRAHLAYLGHAIIGDGKYGKNEINKKFKQNRQKLACFKLKFENVGVGELNGKEFEKYPKWWVGK